MMRLPGRRAGLLFAMLLAFPLAAGSAASADVFSFSSDKCQVEKGSRVVLTRATATGIGRVSCVNHGAYVTMTVSVAGDGPGGDYDIVTKTCNQTKVCEAETAPIIKDNDVTNYCVFVTARFKFSPNGREY